MAAPLAVSGRGLLVLLGLVLLALAVALLVDRGDAPDEGAAAPGALLRITAADLTAVELQRGAGTVRVERAGAELWRMTAPTVAEADPRAVEALVRGIADARVVRELGPVPARGGLARYGLTAPDLVVRLTRRSGGAVSIRVGGTSPVGTERYVATEDGRLRLVDAEVGRAAEQDAQTLLERRLVPLEPDDITSISLGRAGGGLRLARSGQEWRMTEPLADRADAARADALARGLAELSLERPAAPGELAAARRALEREAITVAIATARGPLRVVPRVGRSGPEDGQVWAMRESRIPGTPPLVGAIGAGAVEDLRRPADELRDRQLVRVSQDEVRAITVWRNARTIEIRRAAEGTAWTASPPPGPAHSERVQELLDRIAGLRALSFPSPSPSLPPPSARVTLRGASAELGSFEIFDLPAVAPDRLVRTTWRPGVVARVSPTLSQGLPADAAALRSPAP